MKKFILGFVVALVLVAVIYFGYLFIHRLGDRSVSPEQLNPEAKDFGALRVEVFGKGQPLVGVEVDLGKIGPNGPSGPMSAARTDVSGVVSFEKVPVGIYDIFWNINAFPQGYNQPSRISIGIVKDQIAQKRIDLAPK